VSEALPAIVLCCVDRVDCGRFHARECVLHLHGYAHGYGFLCRHPPPHHHHLRGRHQHHWILIFGAPRPAPLSALSISHSCGGWEESWAGHIPTPGDFP